MVSLVHGGTELPARAIDVTYLRQRRRLLGQQAGLWQMNTAIVGWGSIKRVACLGTTCHSLRDTVGIHIAKGV